MGRSWPAEVEDLLARCEFPPPGSVLHCAVSGGADSSALVILATAWGCRVTAHHVDHGLRPGSSAESAVVAALAERLGAGFRSVAVVVPDGPNLEARARAVRYAALPVGVATGHTMDDQAETVLLNLLRGAGLDGLAGMDPGPAHPLLGLRRTETVAVCAAVGLEPLVDPTNLSPRHRRNRVRAELLPLCSAVADRDVVPVLARQAALLREEAAYLDRAADRALPDPADARRVGAVAATDRPLARRALRRWLRRAGPERVPDGPARPAGLAPPPSAADVARVLAVACGEAVAAEVSGGRRVERSGGRLRVVRPTGRDDRLPAR